MWISIFRFHLSFVDKSNFMIVIKMLSIFIKNWQDLARWATTKHRQFKINHILSWSYQSSSTCSVLEFGRSSSTNGQYSWQNIWVILWPPNTWGCYWHSLASSDYIFHWLQQTMKENDRQISGWIVWYLSPNRWNWIFFLWIFKKSTSYIIYASKLKTETKSSSLIA